MDTLAAFNWLLNNPRDIWASGKRRTSAQLAFELARFVANDNPIKVLPRGPYARMRWR